MTRRPIVTLRAALFVLLSILVLGLGAWWLWEALALSVQGWAP